MQYYTAPMEGLTDRIWRQAHQRWFGAPGAPARYYAPFLSPPENRVLIKKKMAELDPAANPGAPVIPQLLAKDGALAAWMVTELRRLGYTEVNLNFGCPSGTVTAKGKGAGMLRDLSKLEVFLDEVFSQAEGPISVKTRLGVTSPEEFEAILDLYDRYPICELTVHPRVMRQLYRGEADRAAFAKYLPHCQMPVCYNGDITTPAQLKALEAEFPNLSGIMVGRGIIADPALLRQAVGGAPARKEELRGYLDELYHGYTALFGASSCAVSRMKAHWHYLICRFEGSEALEKQLGREPTVEEIAQKTGLPRQEVSAALESVVEPLSLDEPVYTDGGDAMYVIDQVRDPDSEESWISGLQFRDTVAALSPREKRIMELRYLRGKTQMEVAQEIGISQAQVSRLEKGALQQFHTGG